MITKTFEINRKDEWLFLTPKLEDKVTSKFGLKNYEHMVQQKCNLVPNNIIDLRQELIDKKIQGYLDMYVQFYDKFEEYPEIPEDEELNPYLVDNVWLAPVNRNMSNNGKKLIYKYHDNKDDEEEEFLNIMEPTVNKEVYIDGYQTPYYTSNYIFDENYNTNLIHLGTSFYLDYKKDLATEKNYLFTETVSKNGWGFFEIGLRTPNYTTYTPKYAELIINILPISANVVPQTDYHNYPVTLADEVIFAEAQVL
ncbi:hypothetical protein CPAV1605_1054 [seawater metagenome]|uniref:Uncharacterized protein n=1 Tax=seawater metagenome TaxID=1561972 RepID=A0A5E8CIU2_9ZZZZ